MTTPFDLTVATPTAAPPGASVADRATSGREPGRGNRDFRGALQAAQGAGDRPAQSGDRAGRSGDRPGGRADDRAADRPGAAASPVAVRALLHGAADAEAGAQLAALLDDDLSALDEDLLTAGLDDLVAALDDEAFVAALVAPVETTDALAPIEADLDADAALQAPADEDGEDTAAPDTLLDGAIDRSPTAPTEADAATGAAATPAPDDQAAPTHPAGAAVGSAEAAGGHAERSGSPAEGAGRPADAASDRATAAHAATATRVDARPEEGAGLGRPASAERVEAAVPAASATGEGGERADAPRAVAMGAEPVPSAIPADRAAAARPGAMGAAGLQRVLEVLELLEQAPPPRQLTIDLGDARVRVGLEDGQVRLSLLSGQNDATDRWLEQTRQALSERGFDLARDQQQDAEPHGEAPTTASGAVAVDGTDADPDRRVDGALRL